MEITRDLITGGRGDLPDALVGLVSRLLERDPEKRLGAKEAKKHIEDNLPKELDWGLRELGGLGYAISQGFQVSEDNVIDQEALTVDLTLVEGLRDRLFFQHRLSENV
jgi:hypothetical protein